MMSSTVTILIECSAANDVEVGAPGHAAVGPHHLADDACGESSGELAEIDDRFGLTGAFEHAADRCAERKRVPGLGEVARLGVLVAEQSNRGGAIEGTDAGGDTVPDRLDGDRERSPESRRVVVHHGADAELVEPPALDWDADEPAPVRRHEVDGFGRDAVSGNREVALVLAVLVVDDDHELARADIGDRFLDARESHRLQPSAEVVANIVARSRASSVLAT